MKQFRTPVKGETVLFRRIANTVPERSLQEFPAVITQVKSQTSVSLVIFNAFDENGQVARPEFDVEFGKGDCQWHRRENA